MRTYGNVNGFPARLTQPLLHYSQQGEEPCGRQNASSETCKKLIFQKTDQVTEKNRDTEIDVESRFRNSNGGEGRKIIVDRNL